MAQTLVIRRKLSYDHLSAISAISLTGDLYLAVPDHSYKGAESSGSWNSCSLRYRASCW